MRWYYPPCTRWQAAFPLHQDWPDESETQYRRYSVPHRENDREAQAHPKLELFAPRLQDSKGLKEWPDRRQGLQVDSGLVDADECDSGVPIVDLQEVDGKLEYPPGRSNAI